MNKHETDAIRRSHVSSRRYQPAAMFVLIRHVLGDVVELQKKTGTCLVKNSAQVYSVCIACVTIQNKKIRG